MIITAMGWWQPTPGEVVEWHPVRATEATAGSVCADDGPITFLQENHLRSGHAARAAGRAHSAYLGSGTELDGELDVAAMSMALDEFVARHDALRTWFGHDGNGIRRHVIDPEAVAFEAVVGPGLDTAADVTDHLAERFAEEAIADSFPGFAFGAIRHADGFSLYIGCDHAISDGASQALALAEIVSIYETVLAEAPGAPRPAGGFSSYARVDAAVAAAAADADSSLAEVVREWQNVFAANGNRMPGFPIDLGLAPGETAPVRPVEMTLLTADDADEFGRICRAAGGNTLAGVYAALAMVDHELAGQEAYFGMSVLNTRGAVEDCDTAQGWFCAFAPVAFAVARATPFTELVADARTALARTRTMATVPVQTALTALVAGGMPVDEVVNAPNLLSYIDFRWFPGAGTAAYDRGVLFTGEGRTANASLWVNRDSDRLYLGSQTPDTPAARHRLDIYFSRLRAVLADVVAGGDRRVGPFDPSALDSTAGTAPEPTAGTAPGTTAGTARAVSAA
nr:condensation domain-containing protein [Gordonia soli]